MPIAALEITRHPLAPPDTGSPRSTFLAFLDNMNQVYNNQLQTGHLSKEGAAALSRAMRYLDLSEVARSSVREIGEDSSFLLKEILDRIEIPPSDEESETRHSFTKAIFPLTLSITFVVMWWFINSQINLSGYVLDITHIIFGLIFCISSCWTILSLGRGLSESVLSSTRKRIRSIDANAIRIVSNLITIAFLVVFIWNVADYWGIPVHAVLVSAGIAGLAVAFAGREALANIL